MKTAGEDLGLSQVKSRDKSHRDQVRGLCVESADGVRCSQRAAPEISQREELWEVSKTLRGQNPSWQGPPASSWPIPTLWQHQTQ